MGYACPVCDDPQADAEHLANHLAFTALLGDDDHEAWLDDHVPDWERLGEAELADRLTDHADEEEFPQVFEDTTHDHSHDHDHDHDERSGALFEDDTFEPRGQGGIELPDERKDPELDAEAEDILQEAREMTEQMLGESEAERSEASETRTTTEDAVSENEAESSEDGDDTEDTNDDDA